MAITIAQPGATKLAVTAGSQVGISQRLQKEQEQRDQAQQQAARMMQQQIAIQASEAAQKRTQQYQEQRDKLQVESRLKEQEMSFQVDLQRIAIGHKNSLERMDYSQQLDTQEVMRQKQERMDEWTTKHKSIQSKIDDGTISKEMGYEHLNKLAAKYYDVPGTEEFMASPQDPYAERKKLESVVGPEIGKLSSLPELQQEVAAMGLSPEALASYGLDPDDFPSEEISITPEGRVKMISPDGQTGTVESGEVQSYLNQGYQVVGEESANQPPQQEKKDGLGKFFGVPSPAAALWDYTQLNRKVQMQKMLDTREARKTMSLGERLRR